MTNDTTPEVAKHDLAVFIGRFQPFHEGHLSIIKAGFGVARHVLCLIGSANSPRSHRNPFTFDERDEMIQQSVRQVNPAIRQEDQKVFCHPLEDALYNDTAWVLACQRAVNICLDIIADDENMTVANRKRMTVTLIGHNKDNTSYYLNMFPEYHSVALPNHANISSTPMRNAYFSNIVDLWLKNCDGHKEGDKPSDKLVPTPVKNFLADFAKSPVYRDISDEYKFVLEYRAKWMGTPFPVTMVTTDAIVVQSGHILLVRRGGRPGRGLWALPGGYLNQGETIEDGMIREIIEETKIAVSKDDLHKHIVGSRVFDDPNRDPRGRVITHGFRIDLPARRTTTKITKRTIKLPDVTGSDDAEFAQWFPISKITRQMMFADHMDIIRAMIGVAH